MPNPFEFISQIRDMNEDLSSRLDEIIELLKEISANTSRIPDDPF